MPEFLNFYNKNLFRIDALRLSHRHSFLRRMKASKPFAKLINLTIKFKQFKQFIYRRITEFQKVHSSGGVITKNFESTRGGKVILIIPSH